MTMLKIWHGIIYCRHLELLSLVSCLLYGLLVVVTTWSFIYILSVCNLWLL
ncbi:hypothetical protein HanXRQr2_Chr16g0728671 [Helianthus annuus]|uniref:Uncharacterized protein n=1 Tax=Helianthus annuus TaxID=4232 RepID=A0A9K3DQH8_HELAN|nr:hypothetical protein HanXRQr2_Chr16g0728671 [Helianthus annuus]KAJ0819651.1 hypothetical protein HanPSC8_Chr16g0698491 [Helianthus annuus]